MACPVRSYITKRGIAVAPAQLDLLLLPAFNTAWGIVERALELHHDPEVIRRRVVEEVVDLALTQGMTHPDKVAVAAVHRVLPL